MTQEDEEKIKAEVAYTLKRLKAEGVIKSSTMASTYGYAFSSPVISTNYPHKNYANLFSLTFALVYERMAHLEINKQMSAYAATPPSPMSPSTTIYTTGTTTPLTAQQVYQTWSTQEQAQTQPQPGTIGKFFNGLTGS